MNQETLDTTSTLVSEGDLDQAFIKVEPLYVWGVLIPKEDDRVCIKYDVWVVPFHECNGFSSPFKQSQRPIFLITY